MMSPPAPSTPPPRPFATPRRPLANQQLTSTPCNPPPIQGSQSCLPRPLFQEEPRTFSTKKERRGELFRPPPRPPPKSCPPKSRVYLRSSELLKAQLVSFSAGQQTATGTPLHSAAYEPGKASSYFEQAFIKEAEIGAGYFGTVYRVRSKDDHKVYAVKIARERYKGPSDRARKLEEVRKHQFLPPHSNLVRFYNSWEERGRLYQQFELCSQTLQELGEGGDIPQSVVWSYLVDLLQAVQHLHDHDHIHMDIKPENIFIGMDGICKLGDFGLMLDLAAAERTGMEGDPKYLAPEVLQGRYTKACDVFSLGATVLELSCDLDLPRGGDLWHSLRKVGPDPSCTLHLQPELRRVVQLMMTRDEERRPAVSHLLQLPSVRQAVRRRARQLAVARAWRAAVHTCSLALHLLSLLVSFLLHLLRPLFSLLPSSSQPPSTPPPIKEDRHHAVQAMEEFSEDEPDCTVSTVSSPESELAAPLHDSDSSGGRGSSRRDGEGREGTPLRSSVSPPLRHRSRLLARTPGAGAARRPPGTLSPGKRLFFSPQPEEVEVEQYKSLEQYMSPDSSNRENRDTLNSDSDSDPDLVMKPQCLASTFDAFSDDDY